MSKTIRGAKGPGYEYWSRRPKGSGHGCPIGKKSKVITHQIERARSKKQLRRESNNAI